MCPCKLPAFRPTCNPLKFTWLQETRRDTERAFQSSPAFEPREFAGVLLWYKHSRGHLSSDSQNTLCQSHIHACTSSVRPLQKQFLLTNVVWTSGQLSRKENLKLHNITVMAIYGVSVPDTSTQNTRLETLGAENGIRTQTQIPPKPNQGVVKTNTFSSFSLYWGARFPPFGNWSSETLTGPSSHGRPSLRPPRPPSELWEGSDKNS